MRGKKSERIGQKFMATLYKVKNLQNHFSREQNSSFPDGENILNYVRTHIVFPEMTTATNHRQEGLATQLDCFAPVFAESRIRRAADNI